MLPISLVRFLPLLWHVERRSSDGPSGNRPLEDWGKLIGDVPAATAILDRFLHNADVISITGKSYRMKDRAAKKQTCDEKPK